MRANDKEFDKEFLTKLLPSFLLVIGVVLSFFKILSWIPLWVWAALVAGLLAFSIWKVLKQ